MLLVYKAPHLEDIFLQKKVDVAAAQIFFSPELILLMGNVHGVGGYILLFFCLFVLFLIAERNFMRS